MAKTPAPTLPKLERVTLALDQIVENPKNTRRHPPEQIDRLIASLKKFGQTKPLLARKENRLLVAGHGILKAAKQLGLPELEVLLWDTDQRTADAYMLADNRHGDLSSPDEDRVAALLREIDSEDYMAVGFSAEEVNDMLAEAAEADIAVMEMDTSLVKDMAWVSIRCPLARQAEMLKRLQAVMKDFPDVEVELGTVNG